MWADTPSLMVQIYNIKRALSRVLVKFFYFFCVCGWANERTGERANERTSERTNERTGEQANKRTGERANWANERTSERANGRTGERANERTGERANRRTGRSLVRAFGCSGRAIYWGARLTGKDWERLRTAENAWEARRENTRRRDRENTRRRGSETTRLRDCGTAEKHRRSQSFSGVLSRAWLCVAVRGSALSSVVD